MHSRIWLCLLAKVALVASCGPGSGKIPVNPEDQGVIGEELSSNTSLLGSDKENIGQLFLIDEPTHRILQVGLQPLEIRNTFALSDEDKEHTILGPSSGSYVVDFSKKRLEIIRADGEREKSSLAFQGTPTSVAYRGEKGILVMQDDLWSIGVLQLSAEGQVQKSWLGGSLIGKDKSVLCGDLDAEGHLLLGASDRSISVVDLEASMREQSWQFASVATDLEKIYWIAPDNRVAQKSLVLASDTIAVFDSSLKSVEQKIDLKTKNWVVYGKFKTPKPHVITWDESKRRESIHFLDESGQLVSQELAKRNGTKITRSYLSPDAKLFLVQDTRSRANGKSSSHRLSQWRLLDNLVTVDEEIDEPGRIIVGPDMVLIQSESPLGFLQYRHLGDDQREDVKGFNFDYFSRHH